MIGKAILTMAGLMIFGGCLMAFGDGAGPEFNGAGELLRPSDYREWIYLTSGLGMTYGSPEAAAKNSPSFDNVFVNPASYKAFMQTGKWPDKTMFILEIRSAETEVSINRAGRTQGAIIAVEAAVKDEARYPEKWAYFGFGDKASAKPFPKTASCFSCHTKNGGVENTFTQFYPTAMQVARAKGTVNASYIAAEQAKSPHSDLKPAAAQETKSSEVIDVVCNMPVEPKTALTSKYKEKTYYFCQQDCKDNFDKDPAKYAKAK